MKRLWEQGLLSAGNAAVLYWLERSWPYDLPHDIVLHAITGMSIWAVYCTPGRDRFGRTIVLCELMLVTIVGCLVDVDHFIAAGSLSLAAAKSLHSRPYGHSVSFLLLISALFHLAFRSSRHTLLVTSSYLIHLLRDAMRRGLWLWPLGTTQPLRLYAYILTVFMLPLAMTMFTTRYSEIRLTERPVVESDDESLRDNL